MTIHALNWTIETIKYFLSLLQLMDRDIFLDMVFKFIFFFFQYLLFVKLLDKSISHVKNGPFILTAHKL